MIFILEGGNGSHSCITHPTDCLQVSVYLTLKLFVFADTHGRRLQLLFQVIEIDVVLTQLKHL